MVGRVFLGMWIGSNITVESTLSSQILQLRLLPSQISQLHPVCQAKYHYSWVYFTKSNITLQLCQGENYSWVYLWSAELALCVCVEDCFRCHAKNYPVSRCVWRYVIGGWRGEGAGVMGSCALCVQSERGKRRWWGSTRTWTPSHIWSMPALVR